MGSCVRCGEPATPGVERCPHCGALLADSWLTEPAPTPALTVDSPSVAALADSVISGPDTLPLGAGSHGQLTIRDDRPYARGNVLGRGGMGEVKLVTDRDLQRQVVMKTLLPARKDPNSVSRFAREARLTGKLQHPNIVPVHDFGTTADGDLFFTMKQVKGETLKEVIAQLRAGRPAALRRWSLSARLNLFLSICNAIAFAHAREVVHRDLKPENVMVGEFGEVLVMDWGLAKARGEQDSMLHSPQALAEMGNQPELDTAAREARTMEGTVLGTLAYMPPEQARGELKQVDARSDIYALGAILHELLAYRRAFEANSMLMLMHLVLEGNFVAAGLAPQDPPVPRELTAVVVKAMAMDREQRYSSVTALADDVRAYLDGRVLQAADYSAAQRLLKWMARHRRAVIGCLLALAALVAGISGTRAQQQRAQQLAAADAYRESIRAFEAARYDEASQQALRTITLAPQHPHAGEMMQVARAAAEGQRERRAREEQLVPLLAKLRAARQALEAAGQRAGYPQLTAALEAARAVLRIDRAHPAGREGLVRSGRALARRLGADGNPALAEMLLAEAGQLMSPEDLQTERWLLRRASEQAGRRAASAAREALELNDAGKLSRPRTIDRILALPRHALLARAMLDVVTAQATPHDRSIAIEALGRLGMTRTPYRTQLSRAHGYGTRDLVALPLLTALANRAHGGPRKPEADPPVEVDVVEAVSHQLVTVWTDNEHEPTVPGALADALGQLGDPRAGEALAVKRIAVRRGTRLWRHCGEALLRCGVVAAPASDAPADRLVHAVALSQLAELRPDDAEVARRADEAFEHAAREPHEQLDLERARHLLVSRRYRETVELADASLRRRAQAMQDALRDVASEQDPATRARLLRDRQALHTLGLRLASHLKARALQALGELQPALEAIDAAIVSEDLRNPAKENILPHLLAFDLYTLRAGLLAALGREQDALETVNKALQYGGSLQPRCWILRSQLRARRGQIDGAASDLERAFQADPGSTEPLLARARFRLQRGQLSGAVRDATAAIALQPTPAAYLLRARGKAAQTLKGVDSRQRDVREDLDRYEALHRATDASRLIRGQMAMIGGELDAAEAALGPLIRAGRSEAEARRLRGATAALAGHVQLARADLERAIALEPEQAQAHLYLAIARRRLLDRSGALASLTEALRLDPQLPEAFYQRARLALEFSGDAGAAVQDLERAYALRDVTSWPSRERAVDLLSSLLTNLGAQAARGGDRAAARRFLERAQALLAPSSPRRVQLNNMLQQLRQQR